MLKRFNFFEQSKVRVSWQEASFEVSGTQEKEDDERDALQKLPQLRGVAGGGSPFLALGDEEGGLSLVNEDLDLCTFVRAHDKRVNLIHQLDSMPIVVTIGNGPTVGFQDASTLDLEIKFWQIHTNDESPSDEFTGKIRREVLSAKAECIQTLLLGPLLSKEKVKPYWAGDESLGPGVEWPIPTCMDVTEDLKQLAIGFSDGHTILIRSNPKVKPGTFSISDVMQQAQRRFDSKSSAVLLSSTLVDEKSHVVSCLQQFKHIGKAKVTGLGFAFKPDGSQWLWVATNRNLSSFLTSIEDPSGPTSRSRFSRTKIAQVVQHPDLDGEGCAAGCCCLAQPPTALASASNGVLQFVLGKSDRVEYFSPEEPGSVYALPGFKKRLWGYNNYLVTVLSGSGTSPIVQNDSSKVAPSKDVIQLYDFRSKLIALSFTLREEGVGHVDFLAKQWGKLIVVTTTKKVFMLEEKSTQTKLEDLYRRNQFATAMTLAQSSNCSKTTIQNIHKMYGDHLYAKGSLEEAVQNYCNTIGFIESSYVIRRFLESQWIDHLITYLEAVHEHPTVRPSSNHTTLLLNCYTKQKLETKLDSFVNDEGLIKSIDVAAAISVLRDSGYFLQALKLSEKYKKHTEYLGILLDDVQEPKKAISYLRGLSREQIRANVVLFSRTLMSYSADETTQVVIDLICGSSVSQNVESPEGYIIPDDFVKVFVDHKVHLERFLKCVIETDDPLLATPIVWNTYLELVVAKTCEKNEPDEKKRRIAEQLAMTTLKNPSAKYDANQALVLVQSYGFDKGLLYLYERLEMFHMLIRHHMDIGDSEGVIDKCKTYAGKNPNLWVQVLTYLVKDTSLQDSEREIQLVLHHIERMRVLPPMMIVKILSSNPKISLSTIRPYLIGQLKASRKATDDQSSVIEHLRADTAKLKNELHALQTRPKIFNSTKCNLTGAPLELPAVHFLSGNSYNLSALPGGSSAGDIAAVETAKTNGPGPHIKHLEDPKCVAEQQSVADIMLKLKQNAPGVDEEFFNQLEISPDGFHTVAEYFSKCLFDRNEESSGLLNEREDNNKKTPFH